MPGFHPEQLLIAQTYSPLMDSLALPGMMIHSKAKGHEASLYFLQSHFYARFDIPAHPSMHSPVEFEGTYGIRYASGLESFLEEKQNEETCAGFFTLGGNASETRYKAVKTEIDKAGSANSVIDLLEGYLAQGSLKKMSAGPSHMFLAISLYVKPEYYVEFQNRPERKKRSGGLF